MLGPDRKVTDGVAQVELRQTPIGRGAVGTLVIAVGHEQAATRGAADVVGSRQSRQRR